MPPADDDELKAYIRREREVAQELLDAVACRIRRVAGKAEAPSELQRTRGGSPVVFSNESLKDLASALDTAVVVNRRAFGLPIDAAAKPAEGAGSSRGRVVRFVRPEGAGERRTAPSPPPVSAEQAEAVEAMNAFEGEDLSTWDGGPLSPTTNPDDVDGVEALLGELTEDKDAA